MPPPSPHTCPRGPPARAGEVTLPPAGGTRTRPAGPTASPQDEAQMCQRHWAEGRCRRGSARAEGRDPAPRLTAAPSDTSAGVPILESPERRDAPRGAPLTPCEGQRPG